MPIASTTATRPTGFAATAEVQGLDRLEVQSTRVTRDTPDARDQVAPLSIGPRLTGQALGEAAGRGDNTALERAIAAGTDINYATARDVVWWGVKPPLLLAAEKGHWDTVQLLLDHGSAVQWRDRPWFFMAERIYSPLALAIYDKRTDIVERLLDKGADPNGTSLPGSHVGWASGLCLAAACGDVRTMERLLARGANPNGLADDGRPSPLFSAVNAGNIEAVMVLVEHGADLNGPKALDTGLTAVQTAASHHQWNIVEYLVEHGAQPSFETWFTDTGIDDPLIAAIVTDQPSLAKLLLDRDVTVGNQYLGHSAMWWAAYKQQWPLVLRLLDKGAEPNDDTGNPYQKYFEEKLSAYPGAAQVTVQTPLTMAVGSGRLDVVSALIRAGARMQPHSETALPADELAHKLKDRGPTFAAIADLLQAQPRWRETATLIATWLPWRRLRVAVAERCAVTRVNLSEPEPKAD